MTDDEADRPHSRALEPELISDPDTKAKAEAEAANGLRQYDFAVHAVQTAIERKPFKLRLSLICPSKGKLFKASARTLAYFDLRLSKYSIARTSHPGLTWYLSWSKNSAIT